ncbi:MAG: 23S rRNA (adenine(2503)-C(2))-methyltransferase [Omnitrophica bacterium RIFCSPHIGHO2_02_FULL_63_14]|nr:MAG: 23S rRNA (adenine(2503)-C(2))-methyltransferase [Omnitrophica bacterium RIFCSPHIGHO2_02_FULL_63_14]
MTNVLDLPPEDLKKRFIGTGIEGYRADQVLSWIYDKGVYDFDRMTNLPQALRAKLKKEWHLRMPETDAVERSADDQSTKLLLKLDDGRMVETVHLPVKDRRTVCVSTQAGCKFHCAFCASGQAGFFRNLTAGEILSQVLKARELSPDRKITNIVFMGIGEPFDNYDEVLKAVRTLNAKNALGLGARRITISTCGVVPKIEKFAGEKLQVELSVSLHGATDAVRGAIMPVNQAYGVKRLIEACRQYAKKTKRAITFEYILIKGVNASLKDAQSLASLLKGILCKVNLIPYNPIEEFPHAAPEYAEIVAFQQVLQRAGIKTTVRFSKGRDIQAACGQLRSVKMTRSVIARSTEGATKQSLDEKRNEI